MSPEWTRVDTATYLDPFQAPVGIRYVLVNGRMAVRDGVPTGVRAGHLLRGPGWTGTAALAAEDDHGNLPPRAP